MQNNISISRVPYLTQDLKKDCYYVIGQTLPVLAEDFLFRADTEINRDGHVLFVASTPKMVVGVIKGYVVSLPDQRFAKVDCLCVDKKYQRNGIGKQLLTAYENYVVTTYNVYKIDLKSSSGALDFYRRNGYSGGVSRTVYLSKSITR